MPSRLVEDIFKENLCTYFVLPFIGLNKDDFLRGNFIESYVDEYGSYIAVSIIEPYLLSPRLQIIPGFRGIWKSTGSFGDTIWVYVYEIPQMFRDDVQLFLDGKYSSFSEVAKDVIRYKSGLPYNKQEFRAGAGFIVNIDIRLCALEKNNPNLRGFWEQELGVILPADIDLLDKPGYRSKIDLSHFTRHIPTKRGTAY